MLVETFDPVRIRTSARQLQVCLSEIRDDRNVVTDVGSGGDYLKSRNLIAALALLLLGAGIIYQRQSGSSRVTALVPVPPLNSRTGLAVDPSTGDLLKAESAHLLRSRDGGHRWTPLSIPAGLAPNGVSQIAINPDRPASMYVAGIGAGVLLTQDSGATWQPINTGFPSTEVEALAMHSFRRDTLYVSIRGRGMYRTENGGRQWLRMDGGPPAQPVRALAHSSLEGSMNTGWLYAGTKDGPYISMDCF